MTTTNLNISEASGSAAKLPLLKQGRNSLVSAENVSVNVAFIPREKAAEWAAETRRNLSVAIEQKGKVNDEDVHNLKEELITVFITALQQDNRQSWIFLQEVLEIVSPYKEYLKTPDTKKEFYHYLERVVHHMEKHKERLFDLQITESLRKTFPEECLLLSRRGACPANTYCSTASPQPPKKAMFSPRKRDKFVLPDGVNPYSPRISSVEDRYIQPLKIGDISKSISGVALEMAANESIWSHCLGTTALALGVDIPEEKKTIQSVTPRKTTSATQSLPSPRKFQESLEQIITKSYKKEEEVPVMTGREAVKYFAACHHLGQIKSMYFNLTPARHYSPYDLVSVQRDMANPEHYVFSTFGVLHVYPDQPNDSMTLAEWQREAVLWKAVSAIPFFRNYLIRKMFDRWRANKLYHDFQRQLREIETKLLQNIIPYGAALLQISRLLKELITVEFLPFEVDKTYTLGEFENIINYKNIQADKILERFFKYCKMVVTVTAEESFKKLRYCEEQVRKKTYFSKDSLHLQRIKRETREENLRLARSETARLGNFVKLVDHLIVEHMFDMTKTQVINFVKNVLNLGTEAPREGLFKAGLVFTKKFELALFPSKGKFLKVLESSLLGIPAVLCAKAIPMDTSIKEHDTTDDSEQKTQSQTKKKLSDGTKVDDVSQEGSHKLGSQVHCEASPHESHTGETTPEEEEDEESTIAKGLSENVLSLPNLPKTVTPSKKDDDLGVATPRLVVMKAADVVMAVEGEGFMGQYTPLTSASLEQKLSNDEEFQRILAIHADMMNIALEEIDQYCEYNKWLCDIHIFCRTWNDNYLLEFQGAAAFTIEQKLTEIRLWSEKVRNFDKYFVSENGMFCVDCSIIHKGLLPKLDGIYQELITFVAEEAKTLAKHFCGDMSVILQNLKNKKTSVEAFATYAKNYNLYKKNTPHYQQRIEYIKSLFEVIRMSYRQLYPEEEKLEENVWALWEAFLIQMQDAGDFVSTQTPLMTRQLENTFKKLEKEAHRLSEMATSGIFLDPTQNPLIVLKEMKTIREKFFSVQLQLQECSNWRLAICGEPYNLSFLTDMTVRMDVRQELWKYVDVTTHAIKDWKQMLFRKMNTRKALEKILEWQAAAAQLKPHLPHADPVLTTWVISMQEFKNELPVLHKLTHEAIKERHWKAIFLGMNEPYNQSMDATVADMLAYRLTDHADLIESVYLQAVNEYDLEMKFHKIRKMWEERQFKLAKHIPDSMYIKEPAKKTTRPTSKRTSKLERFRQERASVVTGATTGLDVTSDDFYILIEVEDLKYQLEDSYISVKYIKQSPYLGEIGEQVDAMSSVLEQVEEIVDLWCVCQKKWLYLLKVFERPEMYHKLHEQAYKFENIHTKFKDWMRCVSNDSLVMSIVNRRRGEKGYKLLQGDNLRSLFISLIQEQEVILKDLESTIEKTRAQFPRLYFISSPEIVDMLGVSRNPQALVPYARKCFPGIQNLTFSLPPEIMGINSVLDFALNADKLHAVSMVGALGEEVPMFAKLEAYPLATTWLKSLDSIMKNTMTGILQACVQARMEEGTQKPFQILEELAELKKQETQIKKHDSKMKGKDSKMKKIESKVKEIESQIRVVYRHWLLRFPVQCVLIAEAIMWERQISRLFEKHDPDEFKMMRLNIGVKLDEYVKVLKESMNSQSIDGSLKDRLDCLLTCLVIQSVHQRDILDGLLQNDIPSETSFDWLKALRHRMDILNVLRAKTVTEMMQGSMSGRPSLRPSQKSKPKVDSIESTVEDPPKVTRTRTTVSSDYQFSPCYVQQLGNSFYYDYEYLGPQTCLVITPLTDRVFLSLTQAAKNFQCGTLIGPAGTGKSETVRELAKLLGRAVFTITCNNSVTLPMMLQYITGMVQCGCWALFDSTDRLTAGLMSVTAQQLDYLQTAMRTLDLSSENQYKIRGQPRFDKKVGAGDKVIRRNSLTTLHPLPRAADSSPVLERQKTVPHGFNEKGLVTYFEDTWVAERDRRRHSIEKEIEIKESEFYKCNKPPSLLYEHVKYRKKKTEDYKHLVQEPMYVHRIIGNVMFNGKLIQASANYGCFMTTSSVDSTSAEIPENFKLLMRPCAVVLPDIQKIIEVILYTNDFEEWQTWAHKLTFFLKRLTTLLPRKNQNTFGLRDVKKIVNLAVNRVRDSNFQREHSELTYIEKQLHLAEFGTDEMSQKETEEIAIVFGICTVLEYSMEDEDQRVCFWNTVCDVFPNTTTPNRKDMICPRDRVLMEAIKEQLKETKMEENPVMIDKVLHLHSALEMKQPVMLTGVTGSGKSSVLLLLARSVNYLNYKQFAPDHSKDELTITNKGLLYQMKTQKLKILKHVEHEHSVPRAFNKLHTICKDIKRDLDIRKKEHELHEADYPKVDIVRLFPTAMDSKELLGCMDGELWHGGLLTKVVQNAYFMSLAVKVYMENVRMNDKLKKALPDLPTLLYHWIVMDGDLDPSWTEGIKSLLDNEKKLTIANGERVTVKETAAFIFETVSLEKSSPSTVAQCQVIHCGESTVNWTSLYYQWKQTAKSRWIFTSVSLNILDSLVTEVFPPTIKFLKTECCSALLTDIGIATAQTNEAMSGVQEVTSFLKFFTTFLDKYLLRSEIEKTLKMDILDDNEDSKNSSGAPSRQFASRLTTSTNIDTVIPNYLTLIKSFFAFSYIWAFGGYLHDRYREKFSRFAHDTLYSATHPIRLPAWGQVFDYHIDESSGSFVRWGEKQMKTIHGYIITPDVERYTFLVDQLITNKHSVLLSGAPGIGKTSTVQNMVLPRHQSTIIHMSRGMTSAIFQDTLISHIVELRNKSFTAVPPGGATVTSSAVQSHLFFIDDLNMAQKVHSYQPPLEVLRQILSEKQCHDRQRQSVQHMKEAMFVAACTLPSSSGFGLGKSCHVMSSRLTRQFVHLNVFTPGSDILLTLFSRPLLSWLEEFPTFCVAHHHEFAQAMVLGLLDVYQAVMEKLKPTPSHAHYIFSLHDIARVVQGILLMSPRTRVKKKLKKRKTKLDNQKKDKHEESVSAISVVSSTLEGNDSPDEKTDAGDQSDTAEKSEKKTKSAPMMKVIGQLWCHECYRVFSDRLISSEDVQWFKEMLENVAIKYLCSPRPQSMTELFPSSKESYTKYSRSSPLKETQADSPPPATPSDFDNEEINTHTSPDNADTSPAVNGDDVLAEAGTSQPQADVSQDMSSAVSTPCRNSVTEKETPREDHNVSLDTDAETVDGNAVGESMETFETADTSNDFDTTSDTDTQTSSVRPDEKGLGAVPAKRQTSKRGVTFKAGLIADQQHEAYYGPLLSPDDITNPELSSSDFLFSKFFSVWHSELHGLIIEKGYLECSLESLQEALQSCLTVYNIKTSQKLELVFFKEAVFHASRLSRVLALPGGHALLLGLSYSTGRASLARLTAYMANCKLFEPKPQTEKKHNKNIVQEHIKRASHNAGVLGKPTVLLIHEDLEQDCLQDISALMAEGTSPGLYSEQEILDLVSQMMPGGVQTKRVDKIEQAFDRFIKRIKQNLHIVVCINYKGNSYSSDFHSLHEKICLFPNLVKYSLCVDVYMPWSYETYSSIAHTWLEDPKSRITIPWSSKDKDQQISKASYAMAYIHCSAKMTIERQFSHQMEPLRFYTPLTFMEFVHLFKVIAAFIVKREKENVAKYEGALCKIDEAFGSIASYKREVDKLIPKHKAALEHMRSLVEEVEHRKNLFIKALDKCKKQEENILAIQGPLDDLKKSSHSMLDQVNPTYMAAKSAIASLSKTDFDEVRSYREPPELVKYVVNALCVLFEKPQTWEEGKKLLIKENFIQDMIFYDKSTMATEVFIDLQEYTTNRNFQPHIVQTVSKAAAAFCKWVLAIEDYSLIHRSSMSVIEKMRTVEDHSSRAKMKLGKLRLAAHDIKAGLEKKIALHKKAQKKAKSIEKEIHSIENKISRASNLMENMSMQHFLWRSELKKAKRHVRCAPGDAIITAACVCYHGPLEDRFRSELLQDWLNRCRQGNFDADSFLNLEQYSVTSSLELIMQQTSSLVRQTSTVSELSDNESIHSIGNVDLPQVRTFKYTPAVYDSRKYYKSELKKQDTMESIVPNAELDDSDDEGEQSVISTRFGYTLQDILSDFDELSSWRMKNLPTDLHSVQNALLMRVSCFNRKHCWPLLIDPDNQAEVWVKALQNSQNLFSEKDLYDGEEYLEGLPMDLIYNQSPEEISGNTPDVDPPPSRGTALTFSDTFTEVTINDNSTVCTELQNNFTSQDHYSNQTGETDDMRPVTSVTNSWETFSLQADNSIEHPDTNLWIIEADDPSLKSRLINAVVHGVTVLVTHLERKPLDPLFRGLLLKHFYVDKDGNKAIRVGGMIFKYHPNFCLYLSTTVPLFLKGDGLHSFPVHHLCCINMALSDEAIINRLLSETMKFERKEFEGQRRSNENDIILHRQRLAREHEAIREKTLNLDVPLLEDQTMLESLLACQSNVEKNRIILEETRYMGDHLEGKFAHYLPIMTQSTMLYNILKKMFVLHSSYYVPFYKFVSIFISVLKSRDRGKGSLGAPQVRAKELADATMSAIFKYVSMMMFEQHFNLLLLLVSLELMKWSHKASSKEISLFVSGFEKMGLDEQSLLNLKPAWMADKAWIDCNVLESLHHPFHGLCNSLIHNSLQWNEYFEAPIALVNPVPGSTLQELSLFQKCLLWKFCCPHRMAELSKAMTKFELGSIEEPVTHYNIFDVYDCTNQFTPTTFILPTTPKEVEWEGTEGYPYVNPAHEVKRLAKEIGMEGKIRILNFGVASQVAEMKQAITDCMQSGHWLLLKNYHLAENTDFEFFSLLKDIINQKWQEEERQREKSNLTDEGLSLMCRSNPSICSQDVKMHDMFRLWITTRSNGERSIPGILIQHGLRVTCEATADFKGTLQKSYRSVAFLLNNAQDSDQESQRRLSRVMPIALFHSLLLHQSYYGKHAFTTHYTWTLTDLAMSLDIYKKLFRRINDSDFQQLCTLMAQVYSNHCVDTIDSSIVHSLICQLAHYSVSEDSVDQPPQGVAQLLEKLLEANKVHKGLQRVLNTIEDTSARVFSLPQQAEIKLVADKSRIICKDMVQVAGAPELLLNVINPPSATTLPDNLIPQLQSLLEDCPTLPMTSRDEIDPMDVFFHYEVTGFRRLLHLLHSDLELLLRCSRGDVSLNPPLKEMLDAICQDRVPDAWQKNSFPSCSSLKTWLKRIPRRMKSLLTYLEKNVESYNLAVFLRPDQFFDAIVQSYARKNFKDAKNIRLEFQVLPNSISGVVPTGVLVTCLSLNNASWDSTQSVLVEQLPNTGSSHKLPPVWLKPVETDKSDTDVECKTFDCPLYCSTEPELHADKNIVQKLPLQVEFDVQIWIEKRVFLSTRLPNEECTTYT